MATQTRQAVRELMLDTYGLGRRGTNTGTSQTAITDDANFGGLAGRTDIDAGCAVMITSGVAAPEDEITRLSTAPKVTTGVMNLDPGLTAALASTDTFEILKKPLVFDATDGEHSVHGAIDEAARNYPLWERRLVPITLAQDGDMLLAAATAWSNASGTPTLAKADLGFVGAGLRVLRMTAGAASDAVYYNTIPVEELKSYFLEVTGLIGTGGDAADAGTLILRDVTNGENITLDEYTIDRFEPEILMNSVQMPSGCEQVRATLQADASGDIIEWANLIFRKNDALEFTVADRPVPPLYLGKLYATKEGTWGARGTMTEIPAKPIQMGAGIWQYHTRQSLAGYSLWYEEFIQQAALTSDSSTTPIIKEHLAAIAAEKLLYPLRARSEQWAARYMKAARDAAGFMQGYEASRVITQGQRRVPLARV